MDAVRCMYIPAGTLPQAPHICLVVVWGLVEYLGGHVDRGAELCARHVAGSVQDLQNVFEG